MLPVGSVTPSRASAVLQGDEWSDVSIASGMVAGMLMSLGTSNPQVATQIPHIVSRQSIPIPADHDMLERSLRDRVSPSHSANNSVRTGVIGHAEFISLATPQTDDLPRPMPNGIHTDTAPETFQRPQEEVRTPVIYRQMLATYHEEEANKLKEREEEEKAARMEEREREQAEKARENIDSCHDCDL